MGQVVSSLFGGSQNDYEPPVMPDTTESEAEGVEVRDSERRKIRARRGMAGTLLTSPLGARGQESSQQVKPSGLLGG